MTHVYVIHSGDGPVKVGRTNDPGRRPVSLQAGAGARLMLIHVEPFDVVDHARRAERYVHEELSSFRTFGEWFQVNPAKAVELIRSTAALLQQEGCTIGRRKPPARIGKVAVSAYFDPPVRQQLAIMAIRQERSQAALMADALNLLFEKHGEAPIAKA